jgi:hypothetical protein
MVRNLRYKLTYIKVYESFLKPEPHQVVVRLLHTLLEAQQTTVAPLSSHLQGWGVSSEGLQLNQRLLSHASTREDVSSRLRFLHYGISRGVSWYKAQLNDRQMTADPELQQLLIEQGEVEAAKLWHVQAAMSMLSIPEQPKSDLRRRGRLHEPAETVERRRHLEMDRDRPTWKGRLSTLIPRPFGERRAR